MVANKRNEPLEPPLPKTTTKPPTTTKSPTTTTTSRSTATTSPNNTRTTPVAQSQAVQEAAAAAIVAAAPPEPPQPPVPVVPAGLSKDYLKQNLKKLYGPDIKSADDAFNQWHASLSDYLKNANSSGFVPTVFGVNLAISFKASATSETFIKDFDKNIQDWVGGVTWSDGKNTKTANVRDPLGFESFSENHKTDTDVDKYQDALAEFLHNWFSKITV